MDNGQMPPVQTVQPGQPVPFASGMTGQGALNGGGMPMVQQVQVAPEEKKDIAGLIKMIAIIVLSLIALTFIGLFIWVFMQYNEVKEDVDYKISEAVAEAKDEQASQDAIRYQEEAKNPLKTFAGPVDYGQLTFKYPKTWSVYVAQSAVEGGDFNAYFNPIQVDAVSDNTVNALRVTIKNERYENVISKYQRELEGDEPTLTVESVTIGDPAKGTFTANRYTGTIPGTELSGYIVVFKIRDKTAILQTDSTLFQGDFDALLDTITFNA